MSSTDESSESLKQIEPLSILIGALGGEGGGVLSNWLVAAAMAEDYPVQSTSIPGVAQRTGATTYYIEIFPAKHTQLNGKQPLLSLYPSPGLVDLVVVTELVEAGRAIENGFVSPDRTTLIASTHRIYAVSEKSNMTDGRIDDSKILSTAKTMAKHAVLFDLAKIAEESGSLGNAILLGSIAASGMLPISIKSFEQSIQKQGVAVEANLKGFAVGMAQVKGTPQDAPQLESQIKGEQPSEVPIPKILSEKMKAGFPTETQQMIRHGLVRLVDYQGIPYASKYLKRLKSILTVESTQNGSDYLLCNETARYLALWMSYEDAIRVADVKTSSERMEAIRVEVGAKPGELVRIIEFLDPGLEEMISVLPAFIARWIIRLSERYPRLAKFRRPMRIRTHTLWGFLPLWLMARMRPFRPITYRYGIEQESIDLWLSQIKNVGKEDYDLAVEVVKCATLLKGYGSTYTRGKENYERIFEKLINPALNGNPQKLPSAQTLRSAREAALADPDGKTLGQVLNE